MTDQDQRQPAGETQLQAEAQTANNQGAEQTQRPLHEEVPQEVQEVLPELQGEIDEDQVLDAQEDGSDLEIEDADLDAGQWTKDEEEDVEYVDVDDLLAVMGDLREMLEAQSKEIRGLRREMRDLRDAVGSSRQGNAAPRRDFGGRDGGGFRPRDDRGPRRDFGGRDGGGFRPRDDRGPRRDFGGRDGGGFRPRDDRGPRDFGGRDSGDFRPREDRAPRRDFGGRDGGGFRPRDDRGPRDFGGRDSSDFRPREDRTPRRDFGGRDGSEETSSFRPRARADRGWGNRGGDDS